MKRGLKIGSEEQEKGIKLEKSVNVKYTYVLLLLGTCVSIVNISQLFFVSLGWSYGRIMYFKKHILCTFCKVQVMDVQICAKWMFHGCP